MTDTNPTTLTPEVKQEVAIENKETDIAPKAKPPHKTTGERYYDGFQFMVGKVFIIAATAVLAFMADPKHAKDTYLGIPNGLKKFQIYLNEKLTPLAKAGKPGKILAGAATSTMIISWGGNFFIPIIKWLENGREGISNFFNRHFGKPGEEKIAHERLKDLPKQNWMDVIKGRIVAWLTVFTSLTAVDAVVGTNKKGHSRFAYYEELFSRKVICKIPGLGKTAQQISTLPVTEKLSSEMAKNKVYRFGKIAALDLYATSAAIVIWNVVSRFSAKRRADKKPKTTIAEDVAASLGLPDTFIESDEEKQQYHMSQRELISSRAALEKPAASHVGSLQKQRDGAEATPAHSLS